MNRPASAVIAVNAVNAFFAGLCGGLSAETGPLLKVGFAERDITPRIGMEMPGNYGKMFHQKIHDPSARSGPWSSTMGPGA